MWEFHPVNPTKNEYEKRMFKSATSLKHILTQMNDKHMQMRGQLVLKGSKAMYPKELGVLKFEFEGSDGTYLYIDYNNCYELHQFLLSIEYKEECVNKIIIYDSGFFIS
jgi:hypothetical protein